MSYLRKGTIITCENGHPLFDLSEDVQKFTPLDIAQTENWRDGSEHVAGEPIGVCHVCGAKWWTGDNIERIAAEQK